MSRSSHGILFPLRWTAAVRLPCFGHALAEPVLRWPECAEPVLEAHPVPFARIGDWADGAPELVLVELDDTVELHQLAEFLHASGGAALAIVPAAMARSADLPRAQAFAPGLVAVAPRDGRNLLLDCSSATEELLRGAVCRKLLASLQTRLLEVTKDLYALAPRIPFDALAIAAAPLLAPLASAVVTHVRHASGTWWTRLPKPEHGLGIAASTFGILRRTAPRAVEKLRAPEREPVDVSLIATGDHTVALRTLVGELLASHGVEGRISVFAEPQDAMRALDGATGALAVLRARRPVPGDGADRVSRMPALHVPWIALGDPRDAEDGDVRRIHEAGAIAASELPADGAMLPSDVRAAIDLGLRAALLLRDANRLREHVSNVAHDLAPMPPLVGTPGARLADVKKRAVDEALHLYPTHEAAADALCVCPRTIARRTGRR